MPPCPAPTVSEDSRPDRRAELRQPDRQASDKTRQAGRALLQQGLDSPRRPAVRVATPQQRAARTVARMGKQLDSGARRSVRPSSVISQNTPYYTITAQYSP